MPTGNFDGLLFGVYYKTEYGGYKKLENVSEINFVDIFETMPEEKEPFMENKKYKNDKDILKAALTAFSLNALDFLNEDEWTELNKRTDYISEMLEDTYDENGNVKELVDKIEELNIWNKRLRVENTDKEVTIRTLKKENEELKQHNERLANVNNRLNKEANFWSEKADYTAKLLDEARKDVDKLTADVKYYRDKCNSLIHANGALLDKNNELEDYINKNTYYTACGCCKYKNRLE